MKSRSPDFLKKSVDKSKPARYNNQVIEKHAGMAELADALDLGSSGCIHASSSLVTRTKKNMRVWWNWQTRMIQVHMPLQACRFKSCHPHQKTLRSKDLGVFFLSDHLMDLNHTG